MLASIARDAEDDRHLQRDRDAVRELRVAGRTVRGGVPLRGSERGGENRQTERPADLLHDVQQTGRRTRLGGLDARHRHHRQRHEEEAQAEAEDHSGPSRFAT